MSLTIKYTCKKHPNYKAKRRPWNGCQGCWAVWWRAATDAPGGVKKERVE